MQGQATFESRLSVDPVGELLQVVISFVRKAADESLAASVELKTIAKTGIDATQSPRYAAA